MTTLNKKIEKTLNIKIDHRILYALGILIISCLAVSAQNVTKNSQDIGPISAVTEQPNQNTELFDTDSVENLIQNMQAGYITAGEAKNEILDIRFYAKQRTSLTPVEMGVNKRYVAYLNAAIDATNAFSFGKNSKEFQNSLTEMENKKNLI